MTKEEYKEKRSLYTTIRRNVMENEFSKIQICKKNNITEDELAECLLLFDSNGVVSNKLNENNIRYEYLQMLCEDIPKYLASGIDVDGENYEFSVLDYCYLTDLSPKKFKAIFMENITPETTKSCKVDMAKFLYKISDLGCILTRETLISQRWAGSTDDIQYLVDEEAVNYIYKLFEENNIDPRPVLLDKAFVRYYKSEPIFPLEEIQYLEKNPVFIKKK